MNPLCRKKPAFINRAPFGLHKHRGNWDFLRVEFGLAYVQSDACVLHRELGQNVF